MSEPSGYGTGDEAVDLPETLGASSGPPTLADVATTVAHQIRNPLGSITNATYLLRQVLADSPNLDVARALEIVHDEAWRANRIITELMDYARPKPTSRQPVALWDLVTAELDALDTPAGVQIVRRPLGLPSGAGPSPEAQTILADPEQTRTMLRHLLRNAMQAMTGSGELCITIIRDGEHVLAEISDTGPGIAEADREKIFQALWSTKADGMGLGLATARALASRQGATLCCSQPSGPTRFELRFEAIDDGP